MRRYSSFPAPSSRCLTAIPLSYRASLGSAAVSVCSTFMCACSTTQTGSLPQSLALPPAVSPLPLQRQARCSDMVRKRRSFREISARIHRASLRIPPSPPPLLPWLRIGKLPLLPLSPPSPPLSLLALRSAEDGVCGKDLAACTPRPPMKGPESNGPALRSTHARREATCALTVDAALWPLVLRRSPSPSPDRPRRLSTREGPVFV